MYNWKLNRNYRRNKNSYIIKNIIKIDGVKINVSDEVFLAYSKADRRERYISGEVEQPLSLNQLIEDGFSIEKLCSLQMPESLEDMCISKELHKERTDILEKALNIISNLPSEEKNLIKQLYFDNLSTRAIAKQLGVTHRTVSYRRDKILEKIRKMLNLWLNFGGECNWKRVFT